MTDRVVRLGWSDFVLILEESWIAREEGVLTRIGGASRL